jgi:hypothetical protein
VSFTSLIAALLLSAMSNENTQRLPICWTPTVRQSQPEPRRRYPRDTALLAVIARLPVVR